MRVMMCCLSLLLVGGCEKDEKKPQGTCVDKQGFRVPCAPVLNPPGERDRARARAEAAAKAAAAEREANAPGWLEERMDRLAERRRLVARTGVDGCDALESRWFEIVRTGPPCAGDADCVWLTYLSISCGRPGHRAVEARLDELERLDGLLSCGRPLPKCSPPWDQPLECVSGACRVKVTPGSPPAY